MPFQYTQLGRFGELCNNRFQSHSDPDMRAAHALGSNGVTSVAPLTFQQVLSSKDLLDPSNLSCQPWIASFTSIVSAYLAKGGHLLSSYCTKNWDLLPAGFCLHEFTPPLHYWSLRGFSTRATGTTVITRANGSIAVDFTAKPLWNYVITESGDILVGSEDFEWIKHTSLAGGTNVWSAGQIGLENGLLRLVDLQSGHYVTGSILPNSTLSTELAAVTEQVFVEYCHIFSLNFLHPSFTCIWC